MAIQIKREIVVFGGSDGSAAVFHSYTLFIAKEELGTLMKAAAPTF